MRRILFFLLLISLAVPAALAQEVSGTIFEDLNGNGLQDTGEEALEGVSVRLYGQLDAGGTWDQVASSGSDGHFSFLPGNGCFLLQVQDPPGWRRTLARYDERAEGTPGYNHPTGVRRYGGSPQLLDSLLAGTVRYTGMGDSIAWNWNSCFDTSSFYYSKAVRDRLRCVNPSAAVDLDEAAVKGEHTDHLLIDDGDMNNVFWAIGAQPQLVSISIIGNDLLGEEPGANPTQEEINRVVEEMLDSRTNLQEILSSLVSEIPHAEVELNTLYDNLGYDCSSEPFHVEWLPIANHIMRELAWGQARRVTNAEVFAEFAHEDLVGSCTGYTDEICHFLGDDIHPKGSGYDIIREKLWEAIDGVSLGPKDGSGATKQPGMDHGYLHHVTRLYPSAWNTLAGASVNDPEAALDGDDGGAGASVTLGIGNEEFRLSGFPGYYDEYEISRVIVGVRYRTTGDVTDDFYRIEASVDGSFRPPAGHDYTTTDWNYYTPLVGSGGPNMPELAPDYPEIETLVVPNVTAYRTVTSTLTKNPQLSADGSHYEWPSLTRAELGSCEVRLLASPVAGSTGDNFQVVIDAAWLDIYGRETPRPDEVTHLDVAKTPAGGLELSFDTLGPDATYNVYFGTLAPLHAEGVYDHGEDNAAPRQCDVSTSSAGPDRLETEIAPGDTPSSSAYILVTGMVDQVESPAGFNSGGEERDRAQNTCE